MLVDLELHVEGGDEAAAVEPVGGEGDQPVGSVDFGFEALHGDGDFGEKVGPAGGEGEGGEAALDALEFGAGGAQGVGTGSTCRPVIGGQEASRKVALFAVFCQAGGVGQWWVRTDTWPHVPYTISHKPPTPLKSLFLNTPATAHPCFFNASASPRSHTSAVDLTLNA